MDPDPKKRRARAREISKAIAELNEEIPVNFGRDVFGKKKLTQLQCLKLVKSYIQNLKSNQAETEMSIMTSQTYSCPMFDSTDILSQTASSSTSKVSTNQWLVSESDSPYYYAFRPLNMPTTSKTTITLEPYSFDQLSYPQSKQTLTLQQYSQISPTNNLPESDGSGPPIQSSTNVSNTSTETSSSIEMVYSDENNNFSYTCL